VNFYRRLAYEPWDSPSSDSVLEAGLPKGPRSGKFTDAGRTHRRHKG